MFKHTFKRTLNGFQHHLHTKQQPPNEEKIWKALFITSTYGLGILSLYLYSQLRRARRDKAHAVLQGRIEEGQNYLAMLDRFAHSQTPTDFKLSDQTQTSLDEISTTFSRR